MGLQPKPAMPLRRQVCVPSGTKVDMSPLLRLEDVQQFAAINVLSDPGYIHGPKVIPNTAMVRLDWNLPDSKIGHNVMYANYTGTPALSNTVAQAIFAAISTGAGWTALAAFFASTVQLRSVSVLDIRSTTGTLFQSTGAAVPGTSASPALPDEVALAVRFVTPNRGPSGRGRIYIPGWATNALGAAGVVAAAAVTALGTWMSNTVFPAISAQIGAPVLGLPARNGYTSPLTGRVFPPRNATNVTITNVLVPDNHWDSQRRRGLK